METEQILDASKAVLSKIGKGDTIAFYSESTHIEYENDQLKSIEDNNRFAIGLRVFNNGRVGNSFVNSTNDLDFLLKSANESSQFGDEIDIDLPGKVSYPNLGLNFKTAREYPKEKAVRLGSDILQRLKSIDPKAKVGVNLSRSYSNHVIANTSGFSGNYEETHFGFSANMLLVDDDESLLSVSDGDSVYDSAVDVDTACENIEWRYKNALSKVGIDTGYYPVIFAPEALDLLLESIEIAANGKTLYKGISVLGDKIGQKVADSRLSIIDNPAYPGAAGNYPFDDEGVVPKSMPIIENGLFQNFIYDLTTAKRLGKASTGHGSRSVASLPAPSFSNLIFSKGDASLLDMIASIDKGLIVFEFLGGGMSNVIAGDFSVNVELGYYIENGKVRGRVKDAMLSGNVYEVLNRILSIENKLHKQGSLYAPHILFDRLSVAG